MSESDGEQAARSLALEQAYVHDVYEQCAERTVQGRHWPLVQEFLEKLEPGALVCDVGCGNGKYLDVNHNIFKIGVDRCQRFTSIAREKRNEVLVCDNLALPFRDESFDAVLSIAVVHHFSTTDRRVRALKELARVLRIGGRLVISVWAMEQKHRKFESQDVLVPWPRAYCVNSSGSPIRARGMSYTDRHRGKSAQTYLLSKRNSQRRGSNGKSYWIDPIFSPSPSTSSLSSPNETCYSFFRRALQKLAGGRRGSRAWFLENWQNGAKERRLCEHEDEDNVEDLPIELRRLEEGVALSDRHPQHDNLGVKSKSLGDILDAQRLNLVRSRSSVPGLCNTDHEEKGQQPPKPPQLVKQKTHLLDDASTDDQHTPDTAMQLHPKPQGVSDFQVTSTRRDTIVQKQSSMNEELMSIERLKERESTRRNIMKQTSLNEDLIYKDRPVFEVFKDSLYSGNATKRFQILKNGLTNRIRQSTTNIEKVSGMSIKNGFVRILQSWTSTESPVTATTSTVASMTTPTAGLTNSHEICEIPGERRSSREDSDSSKDGSLQSDTSIDSEDSFASVIYVPKKSPSPLLEGHTRLPGHQLGSTSAPPSPRLKCAPELGTAHRHKLIPTSPLLKQFPATSKSLPPPSPPGLSPRIVSSTNPKSFFAGTVEPSIETPTVPIVAIEEAPEPSPPPNDEDAETSKEIKPPGDDEETRLLGLRQIKELLRHKPGFAARTRPAYPLVRCASSGSEPVEKLLPRLLEYELFNPETDDLDSDSSGASSPESMGSVISVLAAAVKNQEETACAKVETKSTEVTKTKTTALNKIISPVESTWNEEYNQHLIDLTDRLSENLIHDIDQFCRKSKMEMDGEDQVDGTNELTSSESRCLLDPVQEVQQEQELDNNAPRDEAEVGRKSSLGRRFGDSVESSDSTITSESSQPESSGSRRLSSSSWSSRPRLCPQTRSASEETRSQGPGNRVRRQQQPSTSNGTLSGSSSQESLPSDQITYHQFYHVFREGELDQLIGKYVENLHVISSYYDHASWCVVAEKVQVWTI